jgi:monovalent cation:H+ antiporter-2, CPA2 family
MHDLPLLINITLALVVAFVGGMIARRLGLPTIVGYLLAGISIGPFTPGFVGDVVTIRQLAELGVIFLMFGVGLHFSFDDLWRVRAVAVPGALLQTALATLLGIGLTHIWGWPFSSGIVLGLAVSVASTVVLLRGLMDHSLLNTSHGQAAVGWLVMEDILSVLILVLMPTLVQNTQGFDWRALAATLVKVAAFTAIVFFIGVRLIPWLLEHTARTRSRELFVLAILAITLGTAMGASELFGVSLALGAFAAGAIISRSHLSHQVGADMFAFREAFSVLFFVSVGMLVNPLLLWQDSGHVAALTLLVVFGKLAIVVVLGLFFPWPVRTISVIAVGLSQIGEFSFILGQAGLSLNLLDSDQYSVILAVAAISITANPFMYRLRPHLEKWLLGIPLFRRRSEPKVLVPEVDERQLIDHVVIIGYGRIGKHLVDVLKSLEIPMLVLEDDVERVNQLNADDVATLYGDAANSEVIAHAHLARARALVVTVPEESEEVTIVASARSLNPGLPIIVRAATEEGAHHLAALGANHIVYPELEGGLELVHHTLLQLGFPMIEVHDYLESVRRDRYDLTINSSDEHRSLHDLLTATDSIEIHWLKLEEDSPLVGSTLKKADIRSRTGASVIALIRDNHLMANPKSLSVFLAGDRIGLIGEREQVQAARDWLVANS